MTIDPEMIKSKFGNKSISRQQKALIIAGMKFLNPEYDIEKIVSWFD